MLKVGQLSNMFLVIIKALPSATGQTFPSFTSIQLGVTLVAHYHNHQYFRIQFRVRSDGSSHV